MQPGLSLTANLVDVYFAPLAARQNHAAIKAGSDAVTDQVTSQVAEAYFTVVRARAVVGITEESVRNAGKLAKVTSDFSRTGEGFKSDVQRAKVEQLIRQRGVEKAREDFDVASARLDM